MSAAVILAGGRGRRLGGRKALHPWQSTTLIEATIARLRSQCSPLLVNVGSQSVAHLTDLSNLGLPILVDAEATAERGPLSGVLTALNWAKEQDLPFVITAPCDMPYLPEDFSLRLEEAPDCDVAIYVGQNSYPLCARWSTRLAGLLAERLTDSREGLAVMRYLSALQIREVPTRNDGDFANINSPNDIL